MILRNHGLLTVGRTVSDAFVAMYSLQRACEIQLHGASRRQQQLINIPQTVLDTVPEYMRQVTRGAGTGIVWPALLRKMDRLDPGYREWYHRPSNVQTVVAWYRVLRVNDKATRVVRILYGNKENTRMKAGVMATRLSVLTRALPSRILVVDDDEQDRELITRRLTAARASKSSMRPMARTRSDVLDRQWYPLVITDWHMPVMDGLALTQDAARARAPRTPTSSC